MALGAFSLSSTRDLFAKLERDADALEQEVTSDRLFNFVVTGYSMIDWVKNDPTIPPAAKTHSILRGLRDDQWLTICGDLATACKHFALDRRKPITTSANSACGFGTGGYGKGGYGIGEESIEIRLNDGTCFQCLDLVEGVITTWQSFFTFYKV
jgi:hypothetical protein